MYKYQHLGGIVALYQAFAYVVGFAMLATVLAGAPSAPAEKLAFLLQRELLFSIWNLIIYVGFGAALVVLALALHMRLAREGALAMPAATAFGLIWAGLVIASGMVANVGLASVAALHASNPAQALGLWQAVGAVQNGLGGGVEVVGGLWMALVSWSAWKTQALPLWLNALGAVVAAAGLLSALPGLGEVGMLFGLGQIVWFAGVGVVLLRQKA